MMMIYLLVAIGFTLQGLLMYFLIRFFFQNQSTSQRQEILHHLTLLQTETRQNLSDRLSTGFLDTQDRLEKSMALNRGELQNGLHLSTQALESKFQSLETQVGLKLESIGSSVESKLNENLKEGFKHFEKVQQHLQAAEMKLASLNTVGQSISDLNNLLKLPHLRGGFGEASLERLLADFLPLGSFELQHAITPNSTERVDAAVKLAKHWLPIDSKFPREQVLPLFESQDPVVLEGARKSLSDFIKTQAKSIAQKYIRPEFGTTDMALLFLPSETLYFEVIRNGDLFESISKLKVFPVSPNTLSISLQAIAMAQEYYEMARGIEKTIEDIRKAKRHFEHFEKKFDDVGKGLKKAQEAFDTAHTHLGHYGSSVYRLTGDTPAPLEHLPPQTS
ncbi:DNA recombination protein RmuC [bacterium]|nr:DNA recombination protein RmuC [bacterium]